VRRLAVLAIVALGALAGAAQPAGAHGGEELGGEVTEGDERGQVLGRGRFTTTRRHHRLYVRVCIQRWKGGDRWDTKGCERDVVRDARNKTIEVEVRCGGDGIYRVKVWGRTRSRDGTVRHSVYGKSPGHGMDC
jgi:hypothetical protein